MFFSTIVVTLLQFAFKVFLCVNLNCTYIVVSNYLLCKVQFQSFLLCSFFVCFTSHFSLNIRILHTNFIALIVGGVFVLSIGL